MMSTSHAPCPIVGMKFRPPAMQILQTIPINTRLILRAEPGNRFDRNAIAVWFSWEDISDETGKLLRDAISKVSHEHQEAFLMSREFQVGYLPAAIAAVLREQKGFPANVDIEGRFYLGSGSATPQVTFSLEDSDGRK